MPSKATTVAAYMAELPPDRRATIQAVRAVILKNLDKGFEEGMQYGMIGYYVPHSLHPAGYHCDPKQPLPYAALGAQKSHLALYSMAVYGDPALLAWFKKAWTGTGKRLDMGKSCIRFKKLDDVPLDVVGELIKRVKAKDYVARYEAALAQRNRSNTSTRKAAPKPSRA